MNFLNLLNWSSDRTRVKLTTSLNRDLVNLILNLSLHRARWSQVINVTTAYGMITALATVKRDSILDLVYL